MKSFDVVYWISLARRQDRQRHFGNNLAELGQHPIQRLEAFDAAGMALGSDWGQAIDLEGAGRGVIGCYLSHMLALQLIGFNGQDALVLEDDVVLCPDFLEKLEAELIQQKAFDILRLSGSSVETGRPEGSHAYLVMAHSAPRLFTAMNQRATCSVDRFFTLANEGDFEIPCTRQRLASQKKTLPNDLQCEFSQDRLASSPMAIAEMTFSQFGEDKFVSEYFAKERFGKQEWRPRFLEIGAFDGKRESNCYRLSLEGWRGVCIEPNPYHFVRLHQCYLGNHRIQLVSGLLTSSNETRTLHLNNDGRSTSDPAVFTATHQSIYFPGHCYVPSMTPVQLAALFGEDFDFVSIDVEGLDQELVRACAPVLKQARLVCVEKNRPESPDGQSYREQWPKIMAELGFGSLIHETHGNYLFGR